MRHPIAALSVFVTASLAFAAQDCDSQIEGNFRRSRGQQAGTYHVTQISVVEAQLLISESSELWSEALKQEALEKISEPQIILYNLVWETPNAIQPWTRFGLLQTVDPVTCQPLENVVYLSWQQPD